MWKTTLVAKTKQVGTIQIIEDVPYAEGESRGTLKKFLTENGVKDIRFRTPPAREEPVHVRGNHKTFREFFCGKHPECDVRVLGKPGEEAWMALGRLTQCMADYMDYIAERILG